MNNCLSGGNRGSDVIVKKTDISISDAERKLNGNYPVVAISLTINANFLLAIMKWPYLYEKNLPSDAKYNPDKYVLPLDIVKRPINISEFDHYAIYLGNKQVAHLPSEGKPIQFDSWKEFHSPSSGSFFKKGNSSSGTITLYHPQIPFKRKGDMIRHIAKAISYEYGRNSYDSKTNNCEHIVKRCILGIDFSLQAFPYTQRFRQIQ